MNSISSLFLKCRFSVFLHSSFDLRQWPDLRASGCAAAPNPLTPKVRSVGGVGMSRGALTAQSKNLHYTRTIIRVHLQSRKSLLSPPLHKLRVEGGIPLPPRVAARGFDGAKPSTAGKWHFIQRHYLAPIDKLPIPTCLPPLILTKEEGGLSSQKAAFLPMTMKGAQ
jgi:hypothetical protein